jgi:hypothetical protein
MQVSGFAGVLIPQTITVYTSPVTQFRGGYTGLSSLSTGANVRVVGLLIEYNGQTVLLAHYVDDPS